VVKVPGGLEPLGHVVLGVGQGAEELSLAGVPRARTAPGGVGRDAVDAEGRGDADQAGERVRVEMVQRWESGRTRRPQGRYLIAVSAGRAAIGRRGCGP
jgi:hypothetical protein